MSTARLVAQRLFFLAAGGWVLRDLPLPAPEVTSFSWLGPACTASAWVKRGLACQPVNRSRPRQSNITVARARRQRLVAWRRAARTPTRLAPPPPCSHAPRNVQRCGSWWCYLCCSKRCAASRCRSWRALRARQRDFAASARPEPSCAFRQAPNRFPVPCWSLI